MMTSFKVLIKEVKSCSICAKNLPFGANPVIQINPKAKILIAGQAPGRRVHETGIPFNDPSGDRLRNWLDIGHDVFYDSHQIALLPMGFCYPGTGKSGDLPPRSECAPAWRELILEHLNQIKLTLVIGQYAQKYHINNRPTTLTELVKSWEDYWPDIVPLPHPSPRNNLWLRKNPWFESKLLPELKKRVADVLA